MTLLIVAALLAGASALWVIQPILARRAALLVDTAPGQLLDAEARKRVALAALKELEYDYLGGKLDDADYRAQRERLSTEALVAIRAAEAVEPPSPGPSPTRGAGRTTVPVGALELHPGTNEFPLSPLRGEGVRGRGGPAGEREPGGETPAPHTCGFLNPADSRFCAGCGALLV